MTSTKPARTLDLGAFLSSAAGGGWVSFPGFGKGASDDFVFYFGTREARDRFSQFHTGKTAVTLPEGERTIISHRMWEQNGKFMLGLSTKAPAPPVENTLRHGILAVLKSRDQWHTATRIQEMLRFDQGIGRSIATIQDACEAMIGAGELERNPDYSSSYYRIPEAEQLKQRIRDILDVPYGWSVREVQARVKSRTGRDCTERQIQGLLDELITEGLAEINPSETRTTMYRIRHSRR
jgi:hypothetical protein